MFQANPCPKLTILSSKTPSRTSVIYSSPILSTQSKWLSYSHTPKKHLVLHSFKMNSLSITAPLTPQRSRNLTRDQKLQIFTLHGAGYSRKYIVEFLGVTLGKVAYTLRSGHLSPKKNKGVSPKINTTQVHELEDFVCSSHETRQMSFLDLASNLPNWNVGEGVIKNALIKRRYSRYLSRNKPPLLEENKRIHNAWAEAHLLNSQEDWSLILWSDETWINDGKITSHFLTRKMKNMTVLVTEKRRTNDWWMFWGSFSGSQKGEHLFWERQWGKVTANSYAEHVLPRVADWIKRNPEPDGCPPTRY